MTVIDLPTSSGNDFVKELGEENALFQPANIVSEKDVKDALIETKKKFGKLDAVVNCAG